MILSEASTSLERGP